MPDGVPTRPRTSTDLRDYSLTSICYRLGQLGWNAASAHAALQSVLGREIKLSTVSTGVSDGKNPKYEQGRAAPLTNGQVAQLARAIGRRADGAADNPPSYPDEVMGAERLVEGACRTVTVNAYERNPEARRQCIAEYQSRCYICAFDFGVVYGPEFAGYIHVHHLRPLSEVDGEYVVDPVGDLRPVCPNCHAIIHHGGQLRSLEEVQRLLARRKPTRPVAGHTRPPGGRPT